MGYIGKPPEQGRYGKLDQISSGFNGSTATFNLTVGSEAVYPVNPQALIISLNGVIQQPGTDYTVSSATITFTTNPASGVGFFGVILGDALDIGTPSDGSVTVAKMAANSVDSAQYVDGSIDLVHMSAESVDSNQYVDGSIDRVHLAADIIDGTKIADDVINSEHYAAASIDNEHLADNAVNSAELAAGSVDTAHIAASQITNALMADDAIGVAELSATGTASSSTFLRGDNAWAAAGGGNLVLINTTVASNDATIEVDGLDSTYDTYMIALSDIVPVTSAEDCGIRLGDSSSFRTGSYEYHAGTGMHSGSSSYSAQNSTSTNKIKLCPSGLGNSSGLGLGAVLWLHRPGDGTTRPIISGTVAYVRADGNVSGGVVIGELNENSFVLTRIQFLSDSGNVSTGRLTVWGVAHA
jgi:hypothetical protein